MFLYCVLAVFLYFVIRRILLSFKVGNYSDKYVFITGCDTGFGRDLTIKLDGLGFHVFAGCLTEKGKKDLAQLCSNQVKTCILDVTREESIHEAFKFVQEHLPRGKGLWAVVNNAGIGGVQATPEMLVTKDYQNTINVNLLGPIEVARRFLPLLRKEKGRLVNITSIMGRFAGVNAPYCVSKFGFEGYLDVLRRDLYPHGVKVCILEPGFFPTNIVLNSDGYNVATRRAFERCDDEVKNCYGHDFCEHSGDALRFLQQTMHSDPAWVVDSYTHAICARFPKTRYVVGWDAIFFFIPMAYLPDWLTDWVIAQQRAALKKKFKARNTPNI